jgi:hypothetical protein
MLIRSTCACVLALSASSSFAQSVPIQHELSIGFSDIRDADDSFIGASYRYYFGGVNINKQPWAISPYLQRSNNIEVDYFGIEGLDSFNIRGEWFDTKDWIVRGRYGRITQQSRSYKDTLQRLGADFSTFANANWEYGAGFDLYDTKEKFRGVNGENDVKRFSGSEFSVNVFARYTSFASSIKKFTPGWDVKFKGTNFDDEFSLELDADYYFKANWSVGVMAIHESNERFGSGNLIELGTDFWFNPYSSIKFGAGYDTDEKALGSLTLLATFRF